MRFTAISFNLGFLIGLVLCLFLIYAGKVDWYTLMAIILLTTDIKYTWRR